MKEGILGVALGKEGMKRMTALLMSFGVCYKFFNGGTHKIYVVWFQKALEESLSSSVYIFPNN